MYQIVRWYLVVQMVLCSMPAAHVDSSLVLGVIAVESQGYAEAVSQSGAVGLMQIMPREAGIFDRPPAQQLANPIVNIWYGIGYLEWLMRRYNGDVGKALAAYCIGPRRVPISGPIQHRAAQEYAQRVLRMSGSIQRVLFLWPGYGEQRNELLPFAVLHSRHVLGVSGD